MYYAYWSGFDADRTHRLFVRDGLFCVAVPTNDGLTFVGFAWPHAEFARVRADIGKAYREAAATLPWIADRLASAEQAERFVGTGDLDAILPHRIRPRLGAARRRRTITRIRSPRRA